MTSLSWVQARRENTAQESWPTADCGSPSFPPSGSGASGSRGGNGAGGMNHLSFGRKEEGGLGTRIPSFVFLFELLTNFFSIAQWPWQVAVPGGAGADDGRHIFWEVKGSHNTLYLLGESGELGSFNVLTGHVASLGTVSRGAR